MIEIKEAKLIDKDPLAADDRDFLRETADYLAYLKEQLNFILSVYNKRINEISEEVNNG